MDTVAVLQQAVVAFSRRRLWDGDPKNLAMSIAVEAAEILEVYQWKATAAPLPAQERADVALECADVLWYLLRLCEAEGIDLAAALRSKLEINAGRFPAVSEGR